MATPTAWWPLRSVLKSLAGYGWGILGPGHEVKGVRAVLLALAQALPDKAGEGRATVPQLAARTGYSERWVSECLRRLVLIGLLEWKPGTVVHGQQVPSWFRVNKALLCDLIAAAAEEWTEKQAARYAAFIERRARTPWFARWDRRKRRSVQVAPSASLFPYGEVSGAPRRARVPDPPPVDTSPTGNQLAGMAAVRAEWETAPKIEGYSSDPRRARTRRLRRMAKWAGA